MKSVTIWSSRLPYYLLPTSKLKYFRIVTIFFLLVNITFLSAENPPSENLSETKYFDELKLNKLNFNLMNGLQLNYLIYNASISI